MIVVCPSCQSRYRFDEAKLGNRPSVKTRCAKCSGAIEIQNPISSATMPPDMPALTPEPLQPEPATPAPAPPSTPPPVQSEAAQRTQETPVQHAETPPPGASKGMATVAGGDAHQMGLLQLPTDKRFSLAVIQGAATGQIYQIMKTRTIIGRSDADINLDDPEASRQHAAVEIVGELAVLRDLGSTNGTWIELDRVEQQEITNQQEFRIGSHVLMFIVTEVE